MATSGFKPKIWVTAQTAYAPGTLEKMASVATGRKKAKARHPARHAARHTLLSNRLAAAAHVDAWHHRDEIAGQR